jgi:catechol 2,3-dioxygenase-like lactoylglutathione lyase family enzyme
MGIELSHIIIPARGKWASATFLASLLDMPAGPQRGQFVPVKAGNGVTLEYVDAHGFDSHHCAFLASEAEFDAVFARVRCAGITYYADPQHGRPGEINRRRGGRGFYFDDPDGHTMEIFTPPSGEPPTPEGQDYQR